LMFSRTSEAQVSVSRFWVAATALGYERDDVLAKADVFLLSKLGEFEVLAGRSFTLWLPGLQAFRKSHVFKQKMREDGLVRYWREHGWPDLCRPLGSEDFVCD